MSENNVQLGTGRKRRRQCTQDLKPSKRRKRCVPLMEIKKEINDGNKIQTSDHSEDKLWTQSNKENCIPREAVRNPYFCKEKIIETLEPEPDDCSEQLRRLRSLDINDCFAFRNIKPATSLKVPADSYFKLAAFIKGLTEKSAKDRKAIVRKLKKKSNFHPCPVCNTSYGLLRSLKQHQHRTGHYTTQTPTQIAYSRWPVVALTDVLKPQKLSMKCPGLSKKVRFTLAGDAEKRFVYYSDKDKQSSASGLCTVCNFLVSDMAEHQCYAHSWAYNCKHCNEKTLFYNRATAVRHLRESHQLLGGISTLSNHVKVVPTNNTPIRQRYSHRVCQECGFFFSNINLHKIKPLVECTVRKDHFNKDLNNLRSHIKDTQYPPDFITSKHSLRQMFEVLGDSPCIKIDVEEAASGFEEAPSNGSVRVEIEKEEASNQLQGVTTLSEKSRAAVRGLMCEVCDHLVWDLTSHNRRVHRQALSCSMCENRFFYQKNRGPKRHLQDMHNLPTEEWRKYFNLVSTTLQPYRSFQRPRCPACSLSFENMAAHKKLCKEWQCSVCEKRACNSWRCTLCKWPIFAMMLYRRRHLRKKHGIDSKDVDTFFFHDTDSTDAMSGSNGNTASSSGISCPDLTVSGGDSMKRQVQAEFTSENQNVNLENLLVSKESQVPECETKGDLDIPVDDPQIKTEREMVSCISQKGHTDGDSGITNPVASLPSEEAPVSNNLYLKDSTSDNVENNNYENTEQSTESKESLVPENNTVSDSIRNPEIRKKNGKRRKKIENGSLSFCEVCNYSFSDLRAHNEFAHTFAFRCMLCDENELFYNKQGCGIHRGRRHKDIGVKDCFIKVRTTNVPLKSSMRPKQCNFCGKLVTHLWLHTQRKHVLGFIGF